LLAQTPNVAADPSYGAWTSAGISGLLSLVIGWLLMKHIPKLMEEQKAEREAYKLTIEKIDAQGDKDRELFRGALEVIQGHNRENTNKVVDAVRGITQAVKEELRVLHRDRG
jgi:hypothetical protein